MARLLVLGRNGQLAKALARRAARHFDHIECAGTAEADMAIPGAVAACIADARPDAVINAAAYTAVDKAETETELAHRINADAAAEAAQAAQGLGARFLQVSTDYVFGKKTPSPFAEDAMPAPLSVYGRTKLEGERAVAKAHTGAAIVRTAAVFSGRGKDFPSAIWRKAMAGETLKVVADQWTCPTYADHLADQLISLAKIDNASGIFHCAGQPGINWFGFAAAALDLLYRAGGPLAQPEKISLLAFKSAAERPADSRLVGSRLETIIGLPAPDWNAGLKSALDVWLTSR